MAESNEPHGVPLPFVRHMLLCEDVTSDPRTQKRVTIRGFFSTISSGTHEFPLPYGFCVYIQLSEGRRSGSARIRISADDTDEVIYESEEFWLEYSGDPLLVYMYSYRVANCIFPAAGT
jgi:hypothetical protein